MNLKSLIGKATNSSLEPNELHEVVSCLEANSCDPYDALLIIGRAGAIQYRDIVAGYLNGRDNPMLARLALMILCRYWKLTGEYKDILETFVRKVEWDDEDDIRVLAISITGSLLAIHPDGELLKLIIRIFRDPSEPQLIREVAYCALAEASGKTPAELPSAARHFDLERDVDPQVIAFIQAAEHRFGDGKHSA
jgi:hypothetical protein